jgi:hypothetical protein
MCRRGSADGLCISSISQKERDLMLACAQHHLKWITVSQALFLKVRQLVVKQKHHLYKYDELAMCVARLTVVGDGAGQVQTISPMREQLYLQAVEVCSELAVPI